VGASVLLSNDVGAPVWFNSVGEEVGDSVGDSVGDTLGLALGVDVGVDVGVTVGGALGFRDGLVVGDALGMALGEALGVATGASVPFTGGTTPPPQPQQTVLAVGQAPLGNVQSGVPSPSPSVPQLPYEAP
jgi:hypothetical protein